MNFLSKKSFLIPTASTIILVAGWFITSSIATNKAEEKINTFLSDSGLQSIVQYDHIKASPFGTVTLDKVSIKKESLLTTIEKVIIHHYENTEDAKAIDIEAIGIDDSKGIIAITRTLAHETAYFKPTLSHLRLQVNAIENKGSINADYNVPHVAQFNLSFDLNNTKPILNLLNQKSKPSTKEFAFSMAMSGEKALEKVALSKANIHIKDDSGMERVVNLFKRYNTTPLPSEDIEKTQNKHYQEKIDGIVNACLSNFNPDNQVFIKVEDSKDAYHNLKDFLLLKNQSLTINITPEHPITIDRLLGGMIFRGIRGMLYQKDNIISIEFLD
ncbi:hypothetical protein [Pelistega ratti]|uniref:hypothetical protein n=1 Tax=Pelistega ratti TaxID=2652177 RepID=UPI00135B8787|nr:hypothetical protein [Pelistega ratti]